MEINIILNGSYLLHEIKQITHDKVFLWYNFSNFCKEVAFESFPFPKIYQCVDKGEPVIAVSLSSWEPPGIAVDFAYFWRLQQ
jgi:hypothetical protein